MTDVIPSQPGPYPVQYWQRGCPKEIWLPYHTASQTYWEYLADGVSAVVPCRGLEYIGGGEVIHVFYEDRSYAWLGGSETEDVDGPYAFGQANWVGGYRYQPGSDGQVFTQRHMIQVPDPDDAQSVIDSLVTVARHLFTLDFTEGV